MVGITNKLVILFPKRRDEYTNTGRERKKLHILISSWMKASTTAIFWRNMGTGFLYASLAILDSRVPFQTAQKGGHDGLRSLSIKVGATYSTHSHGISIKGDWCDMCLKMGQISVVRFTCLNGFSFNLCSICEKHGMVKCPFSGPELEGQWKYPGDHKFEKVQRSNTY